MFYFAKIIARTEMNRTQILYVISLIGLLSCNSRSIGQQVDNTKPMYGEVVKSNAYKELDEDFRKECLEKFKTIDSSVFVQIDHAWRYYYHNDLKTAMKRFNQAWLLNPQFPDSYFGFAAIVDTTGNPTDAERFYKMGLDKDKNKDRAKICYQRIADCKEQLQDFKGTLQAYTKLSEIDPTNAFTFEKIGYFQMQSGNSQAAITAYAKAIELDPTDAVTYNNRGYLYQMNKNFKDAMADYNKAIELDSKYIGAYVNRGLTEMEMKDNQTAKKDFETCVQLDSKAGELRRFLGLAELNLNDKSNACRNFELAKTLGDTQAGNIIKQYCK